MLALWRTVGDQAIGEIGRTDQIWNWFLYMRGSDPDGRFALDGGPSGDRLARGR
jgi:hypothetical protein